MTSLSTNACLPTEWSGGVVWCGAVEKKLRGGGMRRKESRKRRRKIMKKMKKLKIKKRKKRRMEKRKKRKN